MRILLYLLIWSALLFLPNRLLTTAPVHEYLGLIFLLLGGLHLYLVRHYLYALVMRRLPMTPLNAVNVVMLFLLVIVIMTGILISLYAVPVVRLRGLTSICVHAVHLSASILFFLIVGIHAGFHWRSMRQAILHHLPVNIPAALSRIPYGIGVLLISAGLYAFTTTHLYEKILWEHLSFGGIGGTWAYQCDLLLIFLGCMSAAVLFERLRKRNTDIEKAP